MQVDLTIRPLTSTILPSDTDIVAWYTANNECTYYYTSGYDEDEEFPMLRYSPLTGVIEKAIGRNNA